MQHPQQTWLETRARLILQKFLRFAMVGGLATAFQYVVLIIFVEVFSYDAVLASAIGFVASSVLNYRLNYWFTFSSRLPHKIAFPKFIATASAGLIINTGAMFCLTVFFGIYYIASQIVATVLTLIWNFSINSIWSFREREESQIND